MNKVKIQVDSSKSLRKLYTKNIFMKTEKGQNENNCLHILKRRI